MEGVRLVVNKGLSNHFQVSHTITLSTLGESGYRFGSTYVGSKQTGPAEVTVTSLTHKFNFQFNGDQSSFPFYLMYAEMHKRDMQCLAAGSILWTNYRADAADGKLIE